MKNRFLILTALFSALLGLSQAHAEDTVYYVQSTNATVRTDPSFSAKVMAKVTKGQTLAGVSKEGNWIKVKMDGKTGYISSYLVSSQPPLEKQTVIKANEEEIQPSARRRASSFTSAAAARGLTTDENKDGKDAPPDFKAVEKMEATKVTPDEVNKFKESGK